MDINRNILIVDDQEDLRMQVAKLLEQDNANSETSSLIEQIRSRISNRGKGPTTASQRVHYSVDTVGQGKDAYDHVKKSFSKNSPYALMFLDMRMPPGWDGLETAQRIRAIDKEIEIVIMTAYADYEQQEIAEKIGEPDKLLYVKKPFHPEEIRQLALALTEKWNMNRREKERLILTNRLMRENSNLTRKVHKHLGETTRSILDTFLSFLDARSGIVARHHDSEIDVCAATSPEDEAKLLKSMPKDWRGSNRVMTDEKSGSGYFPINFENFSGFVYIEGKNIVFPFEQLQPFLDILSETSKEVLKNSALSQQQAEEKKLASLGTALGKIAGEIKNTMGIVRNYTAQIRDCDDAKERSEMCEQVETATSEILELSNDIVQFSKGHRQALNCSTFGVNELLTTIVDGFRERTDASGAKIDVEVSSDLKVTGDAEALQRALGNLIENGLDAIDTASDKRKTLSVSADFRSERKGSVAIKITDSGNGVPAEIEDTLFDPFVSQGKDGGYGLGATIAKQVIEQHRGRVSIASSDEKGTVCTVLLPVSPDHPPTTQVEIK